MLYAVPQHTTDSLELVKMVLQMIASDVQVSERMRSRVYEVINEAKSLSGVDAGVLQIPHYRESISLAVEMQQMHDLAKLLNIVTSEEMLKPEFAKNLLEYI